MAKAEAKAIISLQARQFYRTLGGVKKATYQAGKYLAGLGIAGGIFSLKRAGEFSAGLAKINTIARLSQTELKKFGREVTVLSEKMGVGKTELFDSIYAALSGGVDTSSVIAFTELADKLGKVGQGTSGEAAEALIRLRKAFPKQSDADIANTVMSTVEKGIITIADLGGNVGKIAGPAAQAGVGMQELMAAIATLSGQMKPEEAITGLRGAIDKLISPSAALAGVFKDMGVKSGEAAIRQFGLLATLKKIGAVGGTTATQLAKLFPEKRARAGVMGLAGKGGKDALATLNAMQAGAGDVETAFNRWTLNNQMHQFNQLKQQFDNIAITIGTGLMPVATEAVAELSKFADNKDDIAAVNDMMKLLAGTVLGLTRFYVDMYKWVKKTTEAILENETFKGIAEAALKPKDQAAQEKLEATGDGKEQQIAAQKLRAQGYNMSRMSPRDYQKLIQRQMEQDRAKAEDLNFSFAERKQAATEIRAQSTPGVIDFSGFDAKYAAKLAEVKRRRETDLNFDKWTPEGGGTEVKRRRETDLSFDKWTPEGGGNFVPTKGAGPTGIVDLAANLGATSPMATANITRSSTTDIEILAELRKTYRLQEEKFPK